MGVDPHLGVDACSSVHARLFSGGCRHRPLNDEPSSQRRTVRDQPSGHPGYSSLSVLWSLGTTGPSLGLFEVTRVWEDWAQPSRYGTKLQGQVVPLSRVRGSNVWGCVDSVSQGEFRSYSRTFTYVHWEKRFSRGWGVRNDTCGGRPSSRAPTIHRGGRPPVLFFTESPDFGEEILSFFCSQDTGVVFRPTLLVVLCRRFC